MTTLSEITRALRRDTLSKQRLYSGAAPYIGSFAFDAAIEEMPAHDFAVKCLHKLGQPAGSDPIRALEAWIAGKQDAAAVAAGRKPAVAQDSGDSFIDKYLGST